MRRNDAFNQLEGGDQISNSPDQAHRPYHLTNRWHTGRLAVRPVILFGLAALACLSVTSRVQADPLPIIGMQGFTDSGITTTDTGSISTATTITFGNWTTTGNNSGIFASMPIQMFGTVSFNITDPSSFTFGNGVFGTFTATSLTGDTGFPPVIRVLSYDGLWTPGTQGGLTGGPFPSFLGVSFLQIGGPGSDITVTGATFTALAPEPSSFVLSLTGLAAGVLIYRRARRNVQTGPTVTV
ncbi:MAG: hypothetical protein JO307_12190 [Bryobacterales bacterium]|nr:hypothetical protein [Bryobacterales bacterium]MBV9398644.1 hypothetical protein [Bryobacterales bacterium]